MFDCSLDAHSVHFPFNQYQWLRNIDWVLKWGNAAEEEEQEKDRCFVVDDCRTLTETDISSSLSCLCVENHNFWKL